MSTLDILGYVASVLVIVSILMRSMIKFRWVNSMGSAMYAIFGFVTAVWPVALFNTAMVLINAYYIRKHYTNREAFRLVESNVNDPFTKFFLEFYEKDIRNFIPSFKNKKINDSHCLLAIRNGRPVGIFVYRITDNKVLDIEVDYVISEFRDLKTGQFIHEKLATFIMLGDYEYITTENNIAEPLHNAHIEYLAKMGYNRVDNSSTWKLDKKTIIERYCSK